MKAVLSRIALIALVSTTVGLVGWQAVAESNRVTFPENIDQLVHYTTVTRGEVTERMLTTPEAIDAVKNGRPIPDGAHFVLADYRDGKIYRYFIMEKGDGWGRTIRTTGAQATGSSSISTPTGQSMSPRIRPSASPVIADVRTTSSSTRSTASLNSMGPRSIRSLPAEPALSKDAQR